MQTQKKKTAIYYRVALADQISLNKQKERLSLYTEKNGYYNVEFYSDNGYSGLNFSRPDFKRMDDDIKLGKVQTVIVTDIARIGRNLLEVYKWIEKITDDGVVFITVDTS